MALGTLALREAHHVPETVPDDRACLAIEINLRLEAPRLQICLLGEIWGRDTCRRFGVDTQGHGLGSRYDVDEALNIRNQLPCASSPAGCSCRTLRRIEH